MDVSCSVIIKELKLTVLPAQSSHEISYLWEMKMANYASVKDLCL